MIYLGDGLYAEHGGYQVRVYASDGERVHDEVFLDADMAERLAEYARTGA